MSDHVRCDNCGVVGTRKRWTLAPVGWLFAEIQDADTHGIVIAYACSTGCALALWKKGPAPFKESEEFVKTPAPPAFPVETPVSIWDYFASES